MASKSVTVARSEKFQPPRSFFRSRPAEIAHGCHADAALHNTPENPYLLAREDPQGTWKMGFLTELFVRPRPQATRYRAALALLNAMSNSDRADIGVKPADFPRIAREMALR